jgi:hypothetical protein
MKLKRIGTFHTLCTPKVEVTCVASVDHVSCLPTVVAKTVEPHTIRELADSKLGLHTGYATRVFDFFFF